MGLKGCMGPNASTPYLKRSLLSHGTALYKGLESKLPSYANVGAAHHDLYEQAGILHRDIRHNNLMVDPDDPSEGISIDSDMASCDRPKYPFLVESTSVAGSNVYLSDQSTPILFRERGIDMILDPFSLTGKPFNSHFAHWSTGSWSGIRMHRRGFLILPSITYLSNPLPLKNEWILPLWRLGINGQAGHFSDLQSANESAFEETLGNRISYDAYMNLSRSS
ncbi:uncharacterized protein EI90DRAFT_3238385 [Cantharellus anzutake]|uniref:uncharacterized protein n=1 Tax=Cantharellus anzutake TaxID=1750568 RepID=UPI0019061615|nr:uncharacterized protein EI90DRAFT_3238385 [Cantharellus anzutake]KAF8325262.1 hypothetical protein EI90DRAFT_3238385 [Cantharellus anzutake]